MTEEPTIVVHHREQLAELLTEAVEVEHNLMCCYLYAAWSLKRSAEEGVTESQLAQIDEWRKTIVHVAIDEMTHFANANNLLSAIGGRGHLNRPNFPVSSGYHPAEVVLALHPFNQSTIEHFVFLERPEGVDLSDGSEFTRPPAYTRATRPSTLMPSAQDFLTVGHLYRGIRDGIEHLHDVLGDELFVGDPACQVSPAEVSLDGLQAVTDLPSALQAIDNIVEQGEGNVDDPENSHYRRLCRVRDAFAELRREDPSFEPARAVARNPVQRQPPTPQGKVWIREPGAARLLDFSNALYNHLLRTLGTAWEPLSPSTRAGLVDEAIGFMNLISPANDALTRRPAGDEDGPRAGMSFAVTREIRVPPAAVATRVLAERTRGLAQGARRLADVAPDVAALADRLDEAAARIAALG